MKICIIGKGYHAKLHQKYIEEMKQNDNIIFYHPTCMNEIRVVNDTQVIIESDLAIIASPTQSHIHYLRLLKDNNYQGYIYVEKPGFDDPRDEKEIIQIGEYFNGRIKIGYHMRDCKVVNLLGRIIKETNNGGLTIARVMITKNISEGQEFQNSWRASARLAICHTLASHLLSIVVELFGIEILEIIELGLIKSNKDADTCILNGVTESVYISGVASWGLTRVSPYIELIGKSSKFIFSNNRLQESRTGKDDISESTNMVDGDMSIKESIQHFTSKARRLQNVDHKIFEENVKITMKSISNVYAMATLSKIPSINI